MMTTENNNQDVCTPLTLNGIQSNNLIKILLDQISNLEYELFKKQEYITNLTGNLEDCAYHLSESKRKYAELEERLIALNNSKRSQSIPPPLPKVVISEANGTSEF